MSRRLTVGFRSGEIITLTALTEACSLLALNVSCLDFYGANQIESPVIFESAYFLLILSFYLLDELIRDYWIPLSSPQSLRIYAETAFIWLKRALHLAVASIE